MLASESCIEAAQSSAPPLGELARKGLRGRVVRDLCPEIS